MHIVKEPSPSHMTRDDCCHQVRRRFQVQEGVLEKIGLWHKRVDLETRTQHENITIFSHKKREH